jgi:predicted DNA-binding protein
MTKTKGKKPGKKKIGRPATGRDKAYAFRLPAELMGRVAAVAEASGVNHSAIVRRSLEVGLDAMERAAARERARATISASTLEREDERRERARQKRQERAEAARALARAEWPATLAKLTSGMTETARAEVYAADKAADAAEAALKAVRAEARTVFGQVYRGGILITDLQRLMGEPGETFQEELAAAKAKHAVTVVNALLAGKKPPRWEVDVELEEAVTVAEQRKAADLAAYLAEHPGATVEDFKAAVEEREEARAKAEAFEQSKRSARLWDEKEAAEAAGRPWSPPEGNDDIGWISKQYPLG